MWSGRTAPWSGGDPSPRPLLALPSMGAWALDDQAGELTLLFGVQQGVSSLLAGVDRVGAVAFGPGLMPLMDGLRETPSMRAIQAWSADRPSNRAAASIRRS